MAYKAAVTDKPPHSKFGGGRWISPSLRLVALRVGASAALTAAPLVEPPFLRKGWFSSPSTYGGFKLLPLPTNHRILNLVEGGGFEPPKLSRQIYSLIPLTARESLQTLPHWQKKTITSQKRGAYSLRYTPCCQCFTA